MRGFNKGKTGKKEWREVWRAIREPLIYLNREGTGPASRPDEIVWRQRVDAKGNGLFIEDPITGVRSQALDLVATNLDPGFVDVLQQLELYRPMLSKIKGVVQRIGADGEPIPGSYMDAAEVFDERAALARELEQALAMTGSPHAMSAIAVHAGGQYFPTNVVEGGVVGNKKIQEAPEMP